MPNTIQSLTYMHGDLTSVQRPGRCSRGSPLPKAVIIFTTKYNCASGQVCKLVSHLGTSDDTLKPAADRQHSNDSIFEDADSSPTAEVTSVLGSAQPQRPVSVSTKHRRQLSDEAVQAAIRQAPYSCVYQGGFWPAHNPGVVRLAS